ncbi:MAG: hypothetical protein K1X91_11985 [Bacteriodetes bacterium]|nr:hypothetical protein [Bacteroidota bacterium]
MNSIELWQEEISEHTLPGNLVGDSSPQQVQLVLMEENNHDAMYPISVLHTQWELRTGPTTIIEGWQRLLQPLTYKFYGRELHINSFLARYPQYNTQQLAMGKVVVLSPRILPTKEIADVINVCLSKHESFLLTFNKEVVGFVCHQDVWEMMPQTWTGLRSEDVQALYKSIEIHANIINAIHEVLDTIQLAITASIPTNQEPVNESDFRNAGVYTVNPQNIFIGQRADIAPLVVLDASAGPIIIDDNVTIMAHASLQGPCYIGKNSIIKMGAKVYHNTVIGEHCKVGGEVEHSIIQGYSNKQHEGFLGHSYLGEWVNLGADTNTSDLKNTYGNITITQRGNSVQTNRMFLGLICGDHSKSGINTMFNTGTVCGIHANVFGAGYTPTELPSFTWGGIGDNRTYALKMALKVARTVMQRRGKTLLPEEEKLMVQEFDRIQKTE